MAGGDTSHCLSLQSSPMILFDAEQLLEERSPPWIAEPTKRSTCWKLCTGCDKSYRTLAMVRTQCCGADRQSPRLDPEGDATGQSCMKAGRST